MNKDMLSRLDTALKAKGTTKAEASRAAGLAPTFLRDMFEGRKKSVAYDNLLALADVLGVTPEWLAEGRGPDAPEGGAEIIGIIPRLKKDDRAKVAEYARLLAEKNRTRN
jgi:transcriptional regulator with XRE-family HTH domain